MRYIILLFISFSPLPVLANWVPGGPFGIAWDSSATCASLIPMHAAYRSWRPAYVVDCTDWNGGKRGTVYVWDNDSSPITEPSHDYQEFAFVNWPEPTTDQYCQSLEPKTFYFDHSTYDYFLNGGVASNGGCDWSANGGVGVCFPGTGECSITLSSTGASPDASTDPTTLPPPDEDLGTGGAPTGWTETTDPATDCPYNYASNGSTTYCYTGSNPNTGADYPDGSTRVDNGDGTYTVIGSDGTSTDYNPDGTLVNPGTAPTGAGEGPTGSGDGENDGCPPWAPAWLCTDVTPPDPGEDKGLPTETVDPNTQTVNWNSGLASSSACPAPQVVTLSIMPNPVEFSYQPFCDLASAIRALVLAAAYMSATFLAYRGLT